MGRVRKATLPPDSLLHAYVHSGDFLDCYACASRLDADTAAARAMSFPPWVDGLLRLRNLAVAPLGLNTALPATGRGESIGHFPLDRRSQNEVILGFDDKHLDFRISVLCDGQRAFAATWVHRNNRFGRAYLAAILPFHILIMRNAMRRVAR